MFIAYGNNIVIMATKFLLVDGRKIFPGRIPPYIYAVHQNISTFPSMRNGFQPTLVLASLCVLRRFNTAPLTPAIFPMDSEAFDALIECVAEGDFDTCEQVPAGDNDGFLVNPLGGIAIDMAGASGYVSVRQHAVLSIDLSR